MPDAAQTLEIEQSIAELRAEALGDLFFFAKGVLGFSWLDAAIHQPLARLLELYPGVDLTTLTHPWPCYEKVLRWRCKLSPERIATIKQKGIPNLLAVLPRGWLKTTFVSQAYPLWRFARDHSYTCLLAQNTFTNATSKLRVIKDLVEKGQLLHALFPEIKPGNPWKDESRCLEREQAYPEATFEAAGTRTQVVSRHYGDIIEDDTVAPELDELGEQNLIPTKDDIQQAIGWHRLVPPLLKDLRRSRNLVVGTRWFVKDEISYIKDHEAEDFVVFERACKEDSAGMASESGTVQWEDRFGQDVLDTLQRKMGPYLYSCLYLNKPVRSQDMLFQPEWISYYESIDANRRLSVFTTVDPGGDPQDTKGEPDYNVVLTTGTDTQTGYKYVLDYFRKKCSPGELIDAIFDHVRKYHPIKVGVETVQYQKTLQYWLRERMRRDQVFFIIEPLTHAKASKSARILGLQPLFQNNVIKIKTWMKDLYNELLSYPLGVNDDIIDALASQLELWRLTDGMAKSELRVDFDLDPMSVQGAIQNIRSRHMAMDKVPLVWDVFGLGTKRYAYSRQDN